MAVKVIWEGAEVGGVKGLEGGGAWGVAMEAAHGLLWAGLC